MHPYGLIMKNWFMLNRLDTIALRLQEHGLIKYFEILSKLTFKQEATTDMKSKSLDTNAMVAAAGGLQEILIACGIYLVGVSIGTFILIAEYFWKRHFP